MKYEVLDVNLDTFHSKVNAIARKCEKYGTAFKCEKLEEGFKTIESADGESAVVKFVVYDVTGAVKFNGWRVIAELEYAPESNIVRYIDPMPGDDIPRSYITGAIHCDHCNTNVRRRYAYVIKNDETGDIKSVGRTCLKEFTCGLSAELVAYYSQFLHSCKEYSSASDLARCIPYIHTRTYLYYAAECIKLVGFQKANEPYPTACRAYSYYKSCEMKPTNERSAKSAIAEMHKINFQFGEADVADLVESALNWICTCDAAYDEYLYKLKGLCQSEYILRKDAGIVASLFRAYEIHKIKEAKKQEGANSDHVGNIGDRIEFDAQLEYITSWSNFYGTCYLYRLTDDNGNQFIWITSKGFDTARYHVRGTVKNHSEYHGTKQTDLTRCKLVEIA